MSNLYPVLSATRGKLDTDIVGGGAPDAHAASHATGGSDPITADDIGALAVTELNKPVHGLNMDGEVISGLAEPSADDHAATKLYVDTAIAGVGSGAAYTVRTKTTTYTAVAGDVLLCDASGGAFTVTLPAAAAVSGSSISVKKTDASANAVTIDGNAAETIDGAATLALSTQYEAVTLWSDGTNWWVF